MAIYKTGQIMTIVSEDMENLELSYSTVKNMMQLLWKIIWIFFEKLNINRLQ